MLEERSDRSRALGCTKDTDPSTGLSYGVMRSALSELLLDPAFDGALHSGMLACEIERTGALWITLTGTLPNRGPRDP